MNKPGQYKWLIVVEGNTDVATYSQLLRKYDADNEFQLFSAHGKGNVCKSANWRTIKSEMADLLSTIRNDIGRKGFKGILLIVDTDTDGDSVFNSYERCVELQYTEAAPIRAKKSDAFWLLDYLSGHSPHLPVIGVSVPADSNGCLETDLLLSYGFPVEGQSEYCCMVSVIQTASQKWNVRKKANGADWWIENTKAKLDKFIYTALSQGFSVCGQEPQLPGEPVVISNIKKAMAFQYHG